MTALALGRWERIDRRVHAALQRRARTGVRELEFAELLRDVAAAARTGATLAQALEQASRRRDGIPAASMRTAAARILMGESVDEALRTLSDELGSAPARLFAKVVSIQHRRGGDLAGPCHRLASLLHERGRLEVEARSATAQARFTSRAVLIIPLIMVAIASWRAPDAVLGMLDPGSLILAAPGLILITLGAVVASRIARTAIASGSIDPRIVEGRGDRPRRVIGALAGDGPLSLQSVRLGICAVLVALPALGLGKFGWFAMAGLVVAAIAWPWSDVARQRSRMSTIVTAGVESLLEVSIALFAAGATAHEVATIAPASCPPMLRAELAPAVHGIGLGRSVASAYRSLEIVQRSAVLDAWLHAVCSSAELGSRAVPVLDQLLRDARNRRREHLRSAAQTAAPRMQLALVLLVVPGVMWLMLLATASSLLDQLKSAGVA